MAEVTLKPDPQHFPIGTLVAVKAAPAIPVTHGEPPGATLSTPAVSSTGTLAVTGLSEGVAYVGWANVGGADQYLNFRADLPPTGGVSPPGAWVPNIESPGAGVGVGDGFGVRLEPNGVIAFRGVLVCSAELAAEARLGNVALPGLAEAPGAEHIWAPSSQGLVRLMIEVQAGKIRIWERGGATILKANTRISLHGFSLRTT